MPEIRYGYTLDGDKRRFLKTCVLCTRADEKLIMMSGYDEEGTCEECGKEDVKICLVKSLRDVN